MANSDSFYEEIVLEVNDVLDELGTTYVISTPGNYNDALMGNLPSTERNVVGLVGDQSIAISVASMAGSGLSADASWMSTKVLILKADSLPVPTESVIVEGVSFPLTKLIAIKPADITVVYMLDVSR